MTRPEHTILLIDARENMFEQMNDEVRRHGARQPLDPLHHPRAQPVTPPPMVTSRLS